MRIIINGLTTITQNLDVLNAIIINKVTIITDANDSRTVLVSVTANYASNNHSLRANPISHITDEMLDDLAAQQEYERSEEYDGVNAWRF